MCNNIIMKLLNAPGEFELLTPVSELKAQLLNIEKAGRTCYQSFVGEINEESAKKFITMLIKRGHLSVIEHSFMSVRFKNISRGFTHELVRHRLAAFSQESTRYVDYAKRGAVQVDLDKFQVSIVSPFHKDAEEKVELDDGRKMSFKDMGEEVEKFYRALRKAGWLPEEARQILPIGLRTEIVITANFREWRHIFYMRTSKYAHWEIRSVMVKLLEYIKPILSPIFDDFEEAGTDNKGYKFYEPKYH